MMMTTMWWLTLVTSLVAAASASAADASQECPEVMCMMHCSNGFEKDAKGCDRCVCKPPPHEVYNSGACHDVTCQDAYVCKAFELTSTKDVIPRCVDPYIPNKCQQPRDTGPCRGSMQRWFYNADTGRCQQFQFGGCQGNDNNFQSEQQCRLSCVPEIEPPEPSVVCPELSCDECASGAVSDAAGCPTCRCQDPAVDCSPTTCLMHCPYGFNQDARGCDVCSCASAPADYGSCANQPSCLMSCANGFEHDARGCDVCSCRSSPPCLRVDCPKRCDFGYARDNDGCELCECAGDPCNVIECPAEYACKSHWNNSYWEPVCYDLHAARPWCRDQPACLALCEHGFEKDAFGCDTCTCLPAPPACVMMACVLEETCEFGVKYDSHGCRTCECLPDPCSTANCSKLNYDACVARRQHPACESCPATATCVFSREIEQVRVRLGYAHDATEQVLPYRDLHSTLRQHVIATMNVRESHVKAFRVSSISPQYVEVEYYVIRLGRSDIDVVLVAEHFMAEINNQELYVVFGELRLVPQQHTADLRFFSVRDYPDEIYVDLPPGEASSRQLLVIVVAVATAVVMLIAFIVIFAVVARSMGKRRTSTNSRMIYTKVPPTARRDASPTAKSAPCNTDLA